MFLTKQESFFRCLRKLQCDLLRNRAKQFLNVIFLDFSVNDRGGRNPHGVVLPSEKEDHVRHLLDNDLVTSPKKNLASRQKGSNMQKIVHLEKVFFLLLAHGRPTKWFLRLIDAINYPPG